MFGQRRGLPTIGKTYKISEQNRNLFTFDPDDREYDFLVVYEDLPPNIGERKIHRSEKLACPKSHSLLIMTEPSSIRIDGLNYLSQFGEIWTSRAFDWETIFHLDAKGCRVNNFRQKT